MSKNITWKNAYTPIIAIYDHEFNFVNIDNDKAELGGSLQGPSHNHINHETI